jgi:hypothetical protein
MFSPRSLANAFVVTVAALSSAAAGTDPSPPPPAPQGATPESLLPALIEHSRTHATLEGGRLGGPGAELLRALGGRAQFVMIGEEHGSRGIASFAAALWTDLHAAGFRYAGLEADPWAVAALERELRAGGLEGWTRYLAGHGGAVSVPFYSWDSEAAWVQAMVASVPAGPRPTLWGLDQVFIGSAAARLADIAREAKSPAARELAGEMAAAAAPDLQWLATCPVERLEALAAALAAPADASLAALVEAMIVSRRIYQPFTTGEGEPWLANQERENLMRQRFLAELAAAERADGRLPKVLLKLGANHVYRGATPTLVQGFGGFASELAVARGGEALTILALCGPGGSLGGFDGSSRPCGGEDDPWAFLAPYLDSRRVTVFDLRSWKLRPKRFAHLPLEVQRAVASFDLLVFPPSAPGASFLPGLEPPKIPQP